MKRLGLLVVSVVLLMIGLAGQPTSAQPATPAIGATPAGTATQITGTITAKGRFIFSWQRDELCHVSFWDYDFTPDLIVTDGNGRELGRLPVSTIPGTVTMEGTAGQEHAEICTVPYAITVPESSEYRVVLDPYFDSGPLSAADLAEAAGAVDIAFERQEGDPPPDLRARPAGPIEGTERYLIDGRLEVRGDPDALDYFATPLGCIPLGGYEDIAIGVQIKVTDQTGAIVGVTELEPIYTDDEKCEFVFTVEVPDATFYTLAMGRRGESTYSKQDLEDAGWRVVLVIGP